LTDQTARSGDGAMVASAGDQPRKNDLTQISSSTYPDYSSTQGAIKGRYVCAQKTQAQHASGDECPRSVQPMA
jgi:hypothetical protein